MTRSVRVAPPSGSYDVVIGTGLLDEAGVRLAPCVRGGRAAVVSDTNVWAAQGRRLMEAAGRAGLELEPLLVAPGESSKSWPALADLCERLLSLKLARDEAVIAFGGGVVGDLAGLAAALLKRGCPWVQIPTSLLAQVDSSVGGKTGINAGTAKNMIGAFHQPALVLIDPACLATLPPRELRAGYAEVVKYGLIGDAAFFTWCEEHGEDLLAGNRALQEEAIAVSVGHKARVVAADERETSGLRALLNLGHTFGHALEAATGFSDRLLHGEAVAIGMTLAFAFSAERGLCGAEDAERVRHHLAAMGLPTSLADAGGDASGSELAELMRGDKKARDGRVPFVLVRGIGRAFIVRDVDLGDVATFLDRQRG